MINNYPSSAHFKKIGRECVSRSILNLANFYVEYKNNKEEYELLGTDYKALLQINYLEINTSIILLHQGVEAYMKSVICEDSPILLIDEPHSNWPTSPKSRNKNFNDFFQIGGAKLITVFSAVYSREEVISEEKYSLLEKIRIIRNEIVHGGPHQNIDVRELLVSAITIMLKFEKGNVLDNIREDFLTNPLINNNEERKLTFKEIIEALKNYLTNSDFQNLMSFDIKGRKYHCPACSMIHPEPNDNLKYSLLKPNEPESEVIKCLICGEEHNAIREKCLNNGCLGDVIHMTKTDFLCLTCFNYI